MSFRSFRDPAGQVYSSDGRIFRSVCASAVANIRTVLDSPAVKEFERGRRLIGTRVVSTSAAGTTEPGWILEHDRIEFPSYPYEWPSEMLHAAAVLTLDFAEALLEEDLGLKDATPYNILFEGPNPVFVDLLSIEQRDGCDPVWLPAAQFERTFLLPLIAMSEFGIDPPSIFLSRRDGLEPQDVFGYCSAMQKLRPSLLLPVTLPAILSRRGATAMRYEPRRVDLPERARFVLRATLKRLRRRMQRWKPPARTSEWTDYMSSATGSDVKQEIVSTELQKLAPRRVLDVGCNTGTYALIAARSGASVVAIDTDMAAVEHTWRAAVHEHVPILPLLVDLTRPSPAVGWKNAECAAFLDRASGAFDLVMMLAVIHHMAITERVPFAEIASLAADLTTRWLIAEWVGPEDRLASSLARGRRDLDSRLRRQAFEDAFSVRFDIIRQFETGVQRSLYVMERRS